MPSGERYRLKIGKRSFDLSPEQFSMLARRSIRLRKALSWNDHQRVKGLIRKRLFSLQDRALVRTELGKTVHNLIKTRLSKES